MSAVVLALVSAFLFGGMSVGLKLGLARHADVALATLATIAGALAVTLVAAVAEAPTRGVHASAAWPFALTGLIQPGVGQLLVTLAIREAGASRASMVFGAAPLVSVTIALVLLGEPARVSLLAGAVLIVAGGVELARERDRPRHVRSIGLVYAFVVTVLFAARDNLLRWLLQGSNVPPAVAAAATALGAALVLAALLVPRIESWPRLRETAPFLGVGALFGSSYVALFEAYYRGRVTVVSPLVATESLWAVGLSLLLMRRTELVGRWLVFGAVLIVAGGALIGAFR
ncbi:MAG TPA: DMT family transporter [Gaiellaceae bacterium]|nr:DMT family transporter [Gaiellaceae bacterium]